MLELGLNHIQASMTLVILNVFFIVISLMLSHLGTMILTALLLAIAAILSYIPVYLLKKEIILNSKKMSKIKFAIVGYGHIGRRHCAMINGNDACQLVAVADTNAEREALADKEFGVPVFSSIDDLLASDIDIDVVNVCTPNGLHGKQQSIKALERKCHVVVEKPMALNKAECEEIIFKSLQVSKHVFCVKQNRYSQLLSGLRR